MERLFGATVMSPADGDELDFSVLLARLRQGDDRAAHDFVSRYTPLLHSLVPIYGVNPQLQRHIESGELVSSVLHKVIQAIRADPEKFANRDELERYLRTTALNERRMLGREITRQKRDVRRTVAGEEAGLESLQATDPTPSQIMSQQEQRQRQEDQLERIADQLESAELSIMRLQAEGTTWTELATQLGTTAEALRKRIKRAQERARKALGDPEL